MLDNIYERRTIRDGLYGLSLTIKQDQYFMVYDDISQENAEEVVDNYLINRQDDGRPGDVKIEHDKNQGIVSIQANLHYTGNEKIIYKEQ
ncbi:MAG: hypothetical protein GX375_08725 [Clostridiales bacterium]|nr:hypothetical protein [Clostridiales bacterium]